MTRELTMVSLAEEYLASRRKLGFALRIEGVELLSFARYAEAMGHRGPLTIALALQWAKLPEEVSPLYWARRLDVVRRFAKYRFTFDPQTEIPPKKLLGPSYRRPPPYIYSHDEINALLQEAGKLPPVGSLRPRTYVVLFGLLASSGLRLREALRLTRADVDLRTGVLTVVKTKFHKSRFVPLHDSTTRALRGYAKQRDCCQSPTRSATFFVNRCRSALSNDGVQALFRAVRRRLVWTGQSSRPPTIRDLRHTFAVSRLLRWYEEGADVDHKIAALSTYLGHVNVTDTYWYLTAVPELMAVTSARYERYACFQAEEVAHEPEDVCS